MLLMQKSHNSILVFLALNQVNVRVKVPEAYIQWRVLPVDTYMVLINCN